jgi:hypothetical protein
MQAQNSKQRHQSGAVESRPTTVNRPSLGNDSADTLLVERMGAWFIDTLEIGHNGMCAAGGAGTSKGFGPDLRSRHMILIRWL